MTLQAKSMERSLERVDAYEKVSGTAPYAYDQVVEDPAYAYPVQSTIAKGRVTGVEIDHAEQVDGVLAVLTHHNAHRLTDTADQEMAVLQSDRVAFRGQFVGAVVAETPEIARYAAGLVRVSYAAEPHDTQLRTDHPGLYVPDSVNPDYSPDTDEHPVRASEAAHVTVDRTYTTPMQHNNPMEPHVTVARWDSESPVQLTLYDSTQGVHSVRSAVAPIFGLELDQVRVVAPHVGGGFGSKGMPHAHDVLACLCAYACAGRTVKLALTRQQTFPLAGHRTPTIQRVCLEADSDGKLTNVVHEATVHTATVKEFAEQAAVGTRMMYASPHVRTTHRLAALDVPVPSWMRAPGECPGFFALESAMDELADACDLDPIELRRRNEPDVDPESGKPWSSRRLLECFEEGSSRFGWGDRGRPGSRPDGRELVGLGVASSTYPFYGFPGSQAAVRYDVGGYTVRIGAVDIGTGARTALRQIAADALRVADSSVDVELGDTDLPSATVAGGSTGLNNWGSAIVNAANAFREQFGDEPAEGAEVHGPVTEDVGGGDYAVHSFGAQFVEARVDIDTGEVRIPRMLGVFSAGRIVNARTARSQFVGGMTMGISMALHENGILDHTTGHVINHDLAQYHVASNADIGDLEAIWLPEPDPHSNAMGAKGIGEIGIVGAAAAVSNAVYNAAGIRVRDLPITPEQLVS